MKRSLIYDLLAGLSVLPAFGAVVSLITPIIIFLKFTLLSSGRNVQPGEFKSALATFFGLAIVTLIMFALADMGKRLLRLEEQQRQLLDSIKESDRHAGQ